ncbi:uncharacterized protein LOC141548475 isoform X5 [Sminthopsis crassicaudata]|uniref:uncharacterized protein LOC141548475 isoform X5 n=1 Tax=Sminthopsis crassicaudata TaxID=9301 RepID=UPI003D68446B
MEEGTKKQEEAKAANEPTDSILEKQPAPTPPQGESEADTSEEDVPQELKVWGYGGAEGGGYWLQEDAVSIPGSAEEDEENEAIQAMALGLELQCRLQLHLDQLEAKAKAKAKSRARARARARAAAAMAARRGSPEPAAGTSANLAAAARPQPSVPRGSQGEPHVRAQERGAALGQAAEEVKPGEKGGRHPFGAPVRKTGKGPRGKEAAAKAREGPPASSPPSICQRRDKCPNLELKGSRATASGTPVARSLERPRAHLGSSWRACLSQRHLPVEGERSPKLQASLPLQDLQQKKIQRKSLHRELKASFPHVPKQGERKLTASVHSPSPTRFSGWDVTAYDKSNSLTEPGSIRDSEHRPPPQFLTAG